VTARARPTRLRPGLAPVTVLADDLSVERRRALRALLSSPLLVAERADPEDFNAVRRHLPWLREWFLEKTGWQLQFDGRAGVARLRKQVGWANADPSRGAVVPGAAKRPFGRRTYVLFCLACAELDRTSVPQVLISALADGVALRASAEGFTPFQATNYGERLDLIDALRLLEALGVLGLVDGDSTRYVEAAVDILYTIDRDRLGRLVATPSVPSIAPDVATLLQERYFDSRDGKARSARHRVMRRLLDDPVVYDAELDAEELGYLRGQRPAIAAWLREAGLGLERRVEGAAAIDPPGDLSDETFPSGGTLGHAALLVAEFLALRGREASPAETVIGWDELRRFVSVLIAQHRDHWAKTYTDAPDGVGQILDGVAERLTAFRLARSTPHGVVPRPAIARFISTELNALAAAVDQLALMPADS
jgi:uncharacterized protein (TIGR02678 family)